MFKHLDWSRQRLNVTIGTSTFDLTRLSQDIESGASTIESVVEKAMHLGMIESFSITESRQMTFKRIPPRGK